MKLFIDSSALDHQKLYCLACDDAGDHFKIMARRHSKSELSYFDDTDVKAMADHFFLAYRWQDNNQSAERYIENLDLGRRQYITAFMKTFADMLRNHTIN